MSRAYRPSLRSPEAPRPLTFSAVSAAFASSSFKARTASTDVSSFLYLSVADAAASARFCLSVFAVGSFACFSRSLTILSNSLISAF